MRMNKRLFYVGSFVAILTFLASLILTVMNKTENSSINYSINVLLAIFGSSFVLIITSIWGYLNERKNYEIQYACFFRDFLLRIVRFLIIYDGKNHHQKKCLILQVIFMLYMTVLHMCKPFKYMDIFLKKVVDVNLCAYYRTSLLNIQKNWHEFAYWHKMLTKTMKQNFHLKQVLQ